MNKTILIYLISSLLSIGTLRAQELNARVVVNYSDRIDFQDPRIFKDMETAFTQFLNDRKWTEIEFKQEERITCNIVLNLKKSARPGPNNFEADVQIQATRPIYGSNYESLLLNYADREWAFEYNQSQPLNFNENTFGNNITSLLSFYAYLIIGLDQDSFKKKGGDSYFLKAQNVVNNAQQSGFQGWSQFGGNNRNRFFLVDGLLNQQMSPVREAYYDYHILAMDIFLTDQDKAREVIFESLKNLKKVNDLRPNALTLTLFLDAKSEELINIYSKGDLQLRKEVYNLLGAIDPSKKDRYLAITR